MTLQFHGAASALATKINGHRLGRFSLAVTGMRPVRPRAGWLYVDIALADPQGELSTSRFVTAIVSGGGRGVKQWVECRIFPQVEFEGGRVVNTRECGFEAGVIWQLGQLIPPGGHLMIDYDSGGQDLTLAELVAQVPPPARIRRSTGERRRWESPPPPCSACPPVPANAPRR